MTKLALLFLAGGVGTLARYGVNQWTRKLSGDTLFETIYIWTIIVNVIGCFLIGLLSPILTRAMCVPEAWRVAILVGLLGGFTTFSTFGLDLFELIRDKHWFRLTAYFTLSCGLGLGAVWLGYTIGDRVVPAPPPAAAGA